MTPLLASWFGYQEVLLLAVLAILLFSRRLPELGRSLGRGIVEFKKGIKGVEDPDAPPPPPPDPRDTATMPINVEPKFGHTAAKENSKGA